MDRDRFWALVEATRDDDCERHAAALTTELRKLSPNEILAFDDVREEVWEEAYTWDLWGAAYLINGGCSDDGLYYFVGWLLGQGRQVFEAAVRTPDSLAEQLQRRGMTAASCQEDPPWCQGLSLAAYDAYEAVTGEDFPFYQGPAAPGNYVPPGPDGEQWDFEDAELMRRRLPRLWAWFIRSVSQQPGTAMDQDPGSPTTRS